MDDVVEPHTRVATWNVNSLRVRLPHVLQWLETTPVDILALQETKLQNDDFPLSAIEEVGYEVIYSGQKTYNGVAILSRQTPGQIIKDIPGFPDPQRRFIAADIGTLHLINLYVPNGEHPDSDKYSYKMDWMKQVQCYIQRAVKQHQRVIVVGDFNIAPDDRDVYDPEKWQDRILCTQPERQAYQKLLDLGLADTFRHFTAEGEHFSWWDYRAAAFRRKMGLRIDHILSSPAMIHCCKGCVIDAEPRRWERPSDHAPVIASYAIPPS